jgi:hypothetical protein
MLGIASSSYGGLITVPDTAAANYLFSGNEFFTTTRLSSAGLTYGTGQVHGANVLDFPNVQFSSVSGGASPSSDFVDGNLGLDITSKDGHGIGGITLDERGIYTFGFAGTGAPAQARVALGGAMLTITAIDGVSVTPTSVAGTMTFQPTNAVGSETFVENAPLANSPNWSGTMTITLPTIPGHLITGAHLVFDNQLATTIGSSTSSFIDKKDVQITVIPTTVVPEPSSIVLLSMGVFGLVFAWSRKK